MSGRDMSERIEVVVLVRDDHLQHLDLLAQSLEAAGLEVRQALKQIGAITGRVRSGQIGSLERVPGVESVSPGRLYAPSEENGVDG